MTKELLDSTQYATDSILKYEQVYGKDFVAPGGKGMARELIGKLNLEHGSRVLDAGCGLGGSAFTMAGEFGLLVDGIDLSTNMITIAQRKLEQYGLSDRVTITHADCMEMNKTDEYQAVYSRDVFLHINDKPSLFKILSQSLKSDGKLLFTDYCCGEKPWQAEFSDYVVQRRYSLHTIDSYADLIRKAGFIDVEASDMSERFIEILASEIARINLSEIEQHVKDSLTVDWQDKIRRTEQGDHRWGLFMASKS
ncbi:MAG: phosphoethanolamine N-methyltransferase [Parasphingorhabdus sp.]|jgi:phosphoethanolamine N-methyltransferase